MWVYLLVLAGCYTGAMSCHFDDGFVFLSTEQVLQRAKLVLHGRDTKHLEKVDPDWPKNRTDSIFNIMCVLKNELNETLGEEIILKRILPRNSCETMPTFEGKEYIVIVRKVEEGVFEWDPVKKGHQAAFLWSPELIDKTMQICGFNNPIPPNSTMNNLCPHPAQNVTLCPVEKQTKPKAASPVEVRGNTSANSASSFICASIFLQFFALGHQVFELLS